MLQKDHLFEWRTIENNVYLGLEIQNKLTEENKAYANHLLEQYGLGEFKHHLPSQLSGGMRQRAALIRTLAVRPEILLLDEPFSALDYQTRLYVSDEIGTIIKNEKKTAILVSHDISEAIESKIQPIVSNSYLFIKKSILSSLSFLFVILSWIEHFYIKIIKKSMKKNQMGKIRMLQSLRIKEWRK